MERCFISWRYCGRAISLIYCCFFLASTAYGLPMEAEEHLRSLEPAPNSMELYDFLDAYAARFAQCQDMESYLKALSYLADNGEKGAVRARVSKIAQQCPALSPSIASWLDLLAQRAGFPAHITESSNASPSTPGISQPLASSPLGAVESAKVSSPVPGISQPATSSSVVLSEQLAASALAPAQQHSTLEKVSLSFEQSSSRPAVSRKTRQAERIQVLAPTPPMRTALLRGTPVSRLPTPAARQKNGTKRSAVSVRVAEKQYYKDGDKGTSRLYKSESIVSAGLNDDTLKVALSTIHLRSFKSTSKEKDTGSSYLSERKSRLRTEETVFVPELSYEASGLLIKIGMSPLGGTVSPLPSARVAYTTGPFSVAMYHEAVADSILSYVGFKDIYTGKKMGRVMKTGGRAAWQDTFSENWFYGMSGSGAYFYGEHVRENSEVKGEAFLGRSFKQFAAGVYISADHFAYNLNNFTYGHGGYYSPQLAASAAAFFSWEHQGENMSCKIDTSLGHLYEEIKEAPKYYLSSGRGVPYAGSYNNNFSSNSGFEAAVLLWDKTKLSVSTRFLSSGKYFEARGGAEMKMEF